MGGSVSRFEIVLQQPNELENDDNDTQEQHNDNNNNNNGSSSNSSSNNNNDNNIYNTNNELLPLLAGSTLRGKVIVVIRSPINISKSTTMTNNKNDKLSVSLPVLQLRFYGKEKIRINRKKARRIVQNNNTSSSSSATMNPNSNNGNPYTEREFISIPLQWDHFPIDHHHNSTTTKTTTTTIPIGTYIFPFQIVIPSTIPSSMYHPYNHPKITPDRIQKMRFRIQYKLQASLFLPSSSSLSSSVPDATRRKPDCITTRYIWIAACTRPTNNDVTTQQLQQPQPCMVEPITMELRSHCFQKKGVFMFGASIENTRIYKTNQNNNINGNNINHHDVVQNPNANDIVALHVSCRNDTTVQIDKVQVSIIEKLTWNTAAAVPPPSSSTQQQQIHPQTGVCTTTTTAASRSSILQQTEFIPIARLDNVQLPGLVKEYKGIIQSTLQTLWNSLGTTTTDGNNSTTSTTRQQFHRQIYNDLISGENLITIELPTATTNQYNNVIIDDNTNNNNNMYQNNSTRPLLRETYYGQLIQVTHFIKITFVPSSTNSTILFGSNKTTPTLEIPIQIVPPLSSISDTAPPRTNGLTCAGTAYYQPPHPSSKHSSTSTKPQPPPPKRLSTIATGSVTESATTTTTTSTNNTPIPNNHTTSNENCDTIPMATAVILSDNNSITSTGSGAASNVIVLGGDSIIPPNNNNSWRGGSRGNGFWNRTISSSTPRRQQREQQQPALPTPVQQPTSLPLSNLVPLPLPTKEFENTVSIPALLNSIRSSMNEYEYIQSKLCDTAYIELFQDMTCDEYGSIIANVHEFDQPRVAVLLAPFVNRKYGGLTCSYAACAIQSTSSHHKAITAEKLIPLCIDIHNHHTVLLNELNGWEQTIVERTLVDAMK